MKAKNIDVVYHLPDSQEFSSSNELIEAVVEPTDQDEKWWGGFKGKKYLVKALKYRYKNADVSEYKPLNKNQLEGIRSATDESVEKVVNALPPPNFNIAAHFYPWFQIEDMEIFNGVMGKTFFGSSFHIYLDTKEFTLQALKETFAHEYNHAIRNQYLSPNEQTIADAIAMEGLAEHFREDVIGGEPAAWSTALDKSEAKKYLKKLQPDLDKSINNQDLYDEIFYDSGEYPRWTGYSVGYQLVEKFIDNNDLEEWSEIMEIPSKEFFTVEL